MSSTLNPLEEYALEVNKLKRKYRILQGMFTVLCMLFVGLSIMNNLQTRTYKTQLETKDRIITAQAKSIDDINRTKQIILTAINQEKKGSTAFNEWIAELLLKASL